jgi:hypothetical protein
MADITLAEWNDRVWLVGGEDHIDDLLANTLDPEITIEIRQCELKSEILDLWHALSVVESPSADPWIIHPAIVARVRRSQGPMVVLFPAWSAAIDAEGNDMIATAASWAEQNPEGALRLVAQHDPTGLAPLADLARMRAQLVAASLERAGVAAGRITHTLDEAPAGSSSLELDRIEIVTSPPAA